MAHSIQPILPVKLDGVRVRKRGKTILDDISVMLDTRGVTMVMGPNGSGKTTLLRLLHGLERPRSGSVIWNTTDENARSRQAFVFQTPVMMRRSVMDNIAYPLILRGKSRSEARSEAAVWADNIGLEGRKKLNAQFLSGGERQKLALARALISSPDVLFLDEPSANLDGQSTKEIEAIVLNASKNGTRIIMTTHDIGQAKRLATEVVFLHNGKLGEFSEAKAFFENPKSEQAAAYLKGDIVV